jgi:hypothetical protein
VAVQKFLETPKTSRKFLPKLRLYTERAKVLNCILGDAKDFLELNHTSLLLCVDGVKCF